MPSLITSDNGVSSGSAGLKTTAASDGALVLQTSTSGGTATNAVYIDTAQNVGVGVTPSAWQSGRKALQVGYSSMNSYSNSQIQLGANFYYDGTNNKYLTSDYSTAYQQINGYHAWYTAASGTAGANITFTQAMTLDASGNLLVGSTGAAFAASGRGLIEVNGTSTSMYGLKANAVAMGYFACSTSVVEISTNGAYPLLFTVNGGERARIDSSGNLLVGTTSKLSGGIPGIDINNSAGGLTFGVSGTSKAFVYTSPSVSRFITESASGYTIAMISGGSAGVVLANGGTSWGSLSDERKKDIIEPIADAANKVSTLRAVIGKYKTDEEGTRRSFLIAQDVQAVLPEAVVEENGDLVLQYTDTIPLLVAAIKEQQAIIQQLQADVAALKGNA